jgi:hypothetical protein
VHREGGIVTGIDVSGGSSGIGAEYESIVVHSQRLATAATELAGRADEVGAMAFNSSLLASFLLCPGSAAAAEAAITAVALGPDGLLPTATEVGATALWSRGAVEAYRVVDAAQAALLEAGYSAGGFVVGAALPGLVVVGGLAVVVTGASNPALLAYVVAHRDELTVAATAGLQQTLYDNPWMLDTMTKLAPTMVQGTMHTLLGGSTPLLAALSGGNWPSGDYEDAIAGLTSAAGLFGYLQDTGGFRPLQLTTPDGAAAPRNVADVFEQQRRLDTPGTIQIIRIGEGADARVMVMIPGTQDWSPLRTDNPVDLTTNVTAMQQQNTVMQRHVDAALAEAIRSGQIPAGAPMMITGHSQGGIVAASLAADPAFTSRYNVESVVTGGSPIGRFDIPDDISVLAVEHDQDPVPMLEGRENPDRPNWVTVERSLAASEVGNDNGVADPGQAHGLAQYTDTGRHVDASTDPSLVTWREHNAQFFQGDAEVYRYQAVRDDR